MHHDFVSFFLDDGYYLHARLNEILAVDPTVVTHVQTQTFDEGLIFFATQHLFHEKRILIVGGLQFFAVEFPFDDLIVRVFQIVRDRNGRIDVDDLENFRDPLRYVPFLEHGFESRYADVITDLESPSDQTSLFGFSQWRSAKLFQDRKYILLGNIDRSHSDGAMNALVVLVHEFR